MHVPVAIVGAGPSGSLLAWILRQRGIDSIVLESRSREYVESRIRAGVMEQNAVDLMVKSGIGDRLMKERYYHNGVGIGYKNEHHFINFDELIGIGVTVYGQSEVTKDLLGGLANEGHNVLYEAPVTAVEDHHTNKPKVKYTHEGVEKELTADFVIGCDGFHGASRKSIPAADIITHEKVYPFGWLGILCKSPPMLDVALFSHHPNGFALVSMRSDTISRLYLQCAPDEDASKWSDEQIWDELDVRVGTDDFKVNRCEIFEKDVAPLRSFFSEPMRYGNMFLAGDASHIVPPTGAKGLNSAFADISVLSAGLIRHFKNDDSSVLEKYAEVALRRNLLTQRFSWTNTAMYHIFPGSSSFDRRMQESQIETLISDELTQTVYAKAHTGLPFEYWPEL
ncbi:MAG: 4-hydroxybenzoate 3-monooxygenase [Rhodospirillaceae bacterium]|jgi:p-hydroxybenzoate 3-monooxygenase|nr:4-hydroxybenzoate 3-monooxygenase [Rhodospirillaceae bacterium]MBT7136588.1 4-hydroxybenzoate 3-monooxygenase [Rhodospirillaceae bacterium]